MIRRTPRRDVIGECSFGRTYIGPNFFHRLDCWALELGIPDTNNEYYNIRILGITWLWSDQPTCEPFCRTLHAKSHWALGSDGDQNFQAELPVSYRVLYTFFCSLNQAYTSLKQFSWINHKEHESPAMSTLLEPRTMKPCGCKTKQ